MLEEAIELLNEKWFQQVIGIIITWLIIIILVKYFQNVIKVLDEKSRKFDLDPRTLKTLDRVLDMIFYIIGVVATLYILEVSQMLYVTLTAFGIIAIIVGFAVRDIVANMFSGIFLILDAPFVIGDFIEVKEFSGTVVKLSLRSTKLRRPDGIIITLPNAFIANNPITNYSLNPIRRVEVKVSIANETDVDKAVRILRRIAEEDERRLEKQSIDVLIADVRDYAVDLMLRFWVKRDDYLKTASDVRKSISDEFKKHNIELAIPLRKNI